MNRPVYISTEDVAKVLGWSTRRSRNWLRRSGAMRKIGGRWYTTPELLRNAFPEVWDRILIEDDSDESDQE